MKFTQSPNFWSIALVFVAITWGFTFVPIQKALNHIDVFSLLFWRFLSASLLMWFCSLFLGIKFDKKTVFGGILLGFMLFCDFTCQTFALNYTLSSSVAFILGLNVVIVPFLLFFFFKKRIKARAFLGAFVAFLGVYCISGGGINGFGIGEALTIISAFAYALHIVFTGVYATKTNVYGLIVTQFLCMSVCAFVMAIFVPHATFDGEIKILGNLIFSPSFLVITALILTSVFATVTAFFVQTLAQKHNVSEVRTVLIFALEPVSAGLLGYFFGEKLTSLQIFGAVCVLSGILISELGFTFFKNKKQKIA